MTGLKQSIKLANFRETGQLLNIEALARPAWPDAMEQVADLGMQAMTAYAPIDKGGTVNRMVRKVQKQPIPKWAVAGTKALRRSKAYPSGYPYPRLTAFSPYAQSRYKAGVNRHKGWFERAVRRVEGALEGILQRALDGMARKWQSG